MSKASERYLEKTFYILHYDATIAVLVKVLWTKFSLFPRCKWEEIRCVWHDELATELVAGPCELD